MMGRNSQVLSIVGFYFSMRLYSDGFIGIEQWQKEECLSSSILYRQQIQFNNRNNNWSFLNVGKIYIRIFQLTLR